MTIKIEDYYEDIKALPIKNSYTKEELLIPSFLIEEEKDIALYYCTHNEHINPNAKIFIIGITPGFNQMNKSIVQARKCIEEQVPIQEVPYLCKKAARFEGSLRKNLLAMLDELYIKEEFHLNHIEELFNERDDLLHTTSMIPFAAFVKGKNYTGHQPNLLRTELFMKYIEEYFYPQITLLQDALIIPLGKCVEDVLLGLIEKDIIKESQCLLGFPHPSGANAHRVTQFNNNKEMLIEKIRNCKYKATRDKL